LTPRQLAVYCSFACLKNAFVQAQFGNLACVLENLICTEVPA
jgi:hypothetical protein